MECFLTVVSFSPSAGQPAAKKYELLNCIVTVQNASSSQLFEKMLSRDVVLSHLGPSSYQIINLRANCFPRFLL